MQEMVDQLSLDDSKVGWHKDRVEAWQRGERIAPVHADVAWSRQCQAACHFCFAQLQSNSGDAKITREVALDFLTDAAEIGVKSISLISDGESTLVPFYEESIEHAVKVGLKIGAGSNGIVLRKPVLERILPLLSFLRFNFSGGERHRYSQIMGLRPAMFDIVVQNIRDGMEIIRRDNLPCTLNMLLVLHPDDVDQIIPFAKLAAECRPSYALIKHCSDGDDAQLGVEYEKYNYVEDSLKEAERIGVEAGVSIRVKWNRINSKCSRTYSRCLGPPFQVQVSGSGLLAPCGLKFNSKFASLHIGNIVRTRFRDLWASDRYKEVMDYLASDEFDPRARCSPGCLQDPTNAFLYEYVNGRVSLPTTPAPPHVEFI